MKGKLKLGYIVGAMIVGVVTLLGVYFGLIGSGVIGTRSEKLIFVSHSASKVYDGTPLTCEEYDILEGELREGHRAEVTFTASQTDVGNIANHFTVVILDTNSQDVTDDYIMEYQEGTLQVLPMPLVLQSASASKAYDGQPLSSSDYSIVSGAVAEGQSLQCSGFPSVVMGSAQNKFTATIYDEAGNDVSSNYNVSYNYGNLLVGKVDLTLDVLGASKVYDGIALVADSYVISEGELLSGHKISKTVYSGQQLNVGQCDCSLSTVIITDLDGNDCTESYSIKINMGKLEVTKRPITVQIDSASKVYDGKPLVAQGYVLADGTVADAQEISISYLSSLTDVGTLENKAEVDIVTIAGASVKANYSVTLKFGTLEITKREISLNIGSDRKEYDGTPLVCESYEITEGSLPEDQFIEANFTASITEVGSTDNKADIDILDINDNSVKSNFSITYSYGTLEVTRRVLKLQTATASKVYDGTPLESNTYEVVEGSVANNQVIVPNFTFTLTNVGAEDNEAEFDIVDVDNNSVVSNYNLTVRFGTLEVTKREISVSSNSDSKVYDGLVLTACGYEITEGSVAEGQTVVDSYPVSITNVGLVDNEMSFDIVDANEESVIDNYEVTMTVGTLEITKREISLSTKGGEWTYDGFVHTEWGYDIISGEEAEGQELFATICTEVRDVTDPEDPVYNLLTFAVSDAEGNDMYDEEHYYIENYDIVLVEQGELKVLPRRMEVLTGDDSWDYDGQTHFNNEVTYNTNSLEAAEGQVLVATKWTEVKNATSTVVDGEVTYSPVDNEITYAVVDVNDPSIDYTSNYEITVVSLGQLTVRRRTVEAETGSDEWIYDGEQHEKPDITLTTPLVDGHQYSISKTTKVQDVTVVVDGEEISYAPVDNVLTLAFQDELGNDVTANYIVSATWGKLTVTRREISVTSHSNSWPYDGTPHSEPTYDLEADCSWVSGHVVTVKTSTQVEYYTETPVENNLTFAIFADFDKDVSLNYKITVTPGTLEITQREVHVSSGGQTWEYDGRAHSVDEDHVTVSNLVSGHLVVVENASTVQNVWDGDVTNSFEVVIYNARFDDVTENYNISYDDDLGVISVFKRNINVSSLGQSWEYDGAEHHVEETNCDVDRLVGGHNIKVVEATATTVKDVIWSEGVVGSTPNLFEIEIFDEDGTDVTDNYDISYGSLGELQITQRDVIVTTKDQSWEYDGTEHMGDDCDVERIVCGHTYAVDTAKAYATITDVCDENGALNQIVSEFEIQIFDENGAEVTDNYNITYYHNGVLTVTPRPICVNTESDSWPYDGNPHSNDYCWATYAGTQLTFVALALPEHRILADGDVPTITEVQRDAFGNVIGIENEFAVKLVDASNNDVSSNYVVVASNYGTLTVYPVDLTIQTRDAFGVYDGETTFSNPAFDITDGIGNLVGTNVVKVNPAGVVPGLDHVERDAEGNVCGIPNVLQLFVAESDTDDTDVTHNYNLTCTWGSIQVSPRELLIRTPGYSKVYDGKSMMNDFDFHTYTVVSGLLTNLGHTIDSADVRFAVSDFTNAQTLQNMVEITKILDAEGNNVAFNYEIVDDDIGELEITKRPLDIKAKDSTFVYDGVRHSATNDYELINETSLAEGQVLKLYVISSPLLDVGETQIAFDGPVNVVDENNSSIRYTDNYEINPFSGKLSITPRHVGIRTGNLSIKYDGKSHSYLDGKDDAASYLGYEFYDIAGIESDDQGIAPADSSNWSVRGENYTDVVVCENAVTLRIIRGSRDLVALGNYVIETDFGTFEIYKRVVHVKTLGKLFEYDGTAHNWKDYPSGWEFVGTERPAENQELRVDTSVGQLPTITNVGTIQNELKFYVYDTSKTQVVTDNYEIIIDSVGTLEVTPLVLYLSTGSNTWEYDGNWHSWTKKDVEGAVVDIATTPMALIDSGTLASGDTLWVDLANLPAIREVQHDMNNAVTYVENSINYKIYNSYNPDATGNYVIHEDFGTLTVTPRTLNVTTHGATWTYDGEAHSYTGFGTGFTLDDSTQFVGATSISATGASITDATRGRSVVNKNLTYTILNNTNDVTNCFTVVESVDASGSKLVINPYALDVTTESHSWEYDGDPHSWAYGSYLGTLAKGDHQFSVDEASAPSVQFVWSGAIVNNLNFVVKDALGNNVTDNYDFNYTSKGTIEVTPREIKIITSDESFVYDGDDHYSTTNSVVAAYAGSGSPTSAALIGGDQLAIDTLNSPFVTEFGDKEENKPTVVIVDEYGTAHTDSYTITYDYHGYLTITKRVLTVTTLNEDVKYDGEAHYGTNYSTHNIVNGQTPRLVDVDDYASIGSTLVPNCVTNVSDGEVASQLLVQVFDGPADVTHNYSIVYNYTGKLKIVARHITVTTSNQSFEYDGDEHFGSQCTFGGDGLLDTTKGHTYDIVRTAETKSVTFVYDESDNLTSVDNKFAVRILDAGGNDLVAAGNYVIDGYSYGKLTVTKRVITVTISSNSRPYNGLPLSDTNVNATTGSCARNEVPVIAPGQTAPSITDVRREGGVVVGIDNYFEVIIQHNNGEDRTKNYTVTVVKGKLTVTPIELKVKTGSATGNDALEYNKAEQYVDSFSYTTVARPLDGHVLVVDQVVTRLKNVTAPTDNILTFKVVSASDHSDDSPNGNYTVTVGEYGKIEIKPYEIVINTASDSKPYDGTALTNSGYTVVRGPLAGDTLTVTMNASQTEIGKCNNTPTIQILDTHNSNADVTASCYKLSASCNIGELEVTKLTLKLKADSDTFPYDGTDKTVNSAQVVAGTLLAGHEVTNVVCDGAQRNVGSCDNNIVSYDILSAGVDVSNYYDVEIVKGKITVTPLTYVVKTYDGNFDYNGLAHSKTTDDSNNSLVSHDAILNADVANSNMLLSTLATGHKMVVDGFTSKIDAGTYENVATVRIVDASGNDVTANYTASATWGSLKIRPIYITLSSPTVSRPYNGEYVHGLTSLGGDLFQSETVSGKLQPVDLTQCSDLVLTGSLVEGHGLVISGVRNVIDYTATAVVNNYSYKIVDATGTDITNTGNYVVETNFGTITITKVDLWITTPSITETYDGLEHKTESLDDCTIVGLLTNDEITSFTFLNSATDANAPGGIENIVVVSEIRNTVRNRTVTQNYDIHYSNGKITIYQKPIQVRSLSASKPQDGTPLTNANIAPVEGLLPNHQVLADVTGILNRVGKTANTLSGVDVVDVNSGRSVYFNYEIERQEGLLVITGDDNEIVCYINTNTSGTIYLRSYTEGNYTGNNDGTGNVFNNGGISAYSTMSGGYGASYLTGLALSNFSQSTMTITPVDLPIYVLPDYLAMTGTPQASDIAYTGSTGDAYQATYYNVDILSVSGSQLVYGYGAQSSYGDGYQNTVTADSSPYRSTSNVSSTLYDFLSVNPDPEHPALINSVASAATDVAMFNNIAQVVRNCASYNLNYNPDIDTATDPVLAFLQAKQGVCRHYARVGALLFRYFGYASRVAYGYLCQNVVAGEDFEVTSSMGHAWVEVYLEDVGWVRVDVTGGASDEFEGRSYTVTPQPVSKLYRDTTTTVSAINRVSGFYNLEQLGYEYEVVVSGFYSGAPGKGVSHIESFKLKYGGAVVAEMDPTTRVLYYDDFRIVFADGELQLYDKVININTTNQTVQYGESFDFSEGTGYTLTGTGLDEIRPYLVITSKVNDNGAPGKYFNTYDVRVVKDGVDITDNYKINFTIGTLTRNKAEITLQTGSVTKSYSDTPFTYEVFHILDGDGHELAVDVNNRFTLNGVVYEINIEWREFSSRGSFTNEPVSYTITRVSDNKVVTSDFNVTGDYGRVVVKK